MGPVEFRRWGREEMMQRKEQIALLTFLLVAAAFSVTFADF